MFRMSPVRRVSPPADVFSPGVPATVSSPGTVAEMSSVRGCPQLFPVWAACRCFQSGDGQLQVSPVRGRLPADVFSPEMPADVRIFSKPDSVLSEFHVGGAQCTQWQAAATPSAVRLYRTEAFARKPSVSPKRAAHLSSVGGALAHGQRPDVPSQATAIRGASELDLRY